MRPLMPLVVVLASACDRGPRRGDVPFLVLPRPVGAPSGSAPASPGTCPVAAGYRGMVNAEPVFARLGVSGDQLRGRYFTERQGVDIRLSGTISAAGVVRFDQVVAGNVTGTFDGTCDLVTGRIFGTWTGLPRPSPFELNPIVARSGTPIFVARHFTIERPVQHVGPMGMTSCIYNEARVEIFALRDPAVELALDRQGLEPETTPLLDPGDAEEVERCQTGVRVETRQTVRAIFRELMTVEESGQLQVDGAAQPSPTVFQRNVVDLRTGRNVVATVFAKDPTPLLTLCLQRIRYSHRFDEADHLPYMAKDTFDLSALGVHFYGTGHPQASASMNGLGPTIPYDVLLRDGYLSSDSPAARAWEGVLPAPQAKGSCGDINDRWWEVSPKP